MKICICLLFCLFAFGFLRSQPEADTTIYQDVDEDAQFSGGKVAMMKFITQNMVYPEMDDIEIFSGIWLRFVVEKDGSLTHIQLLRPTGMHQLEAETIRLIQTMPKWIPATINGKPVRSVYDLPVKICFTN